MMKIMTEIVKTIFTILCNDGYAAQYDERHTDKKSKATDQS